MVRGYTMTRRKRMGNGKKKHRKCINCGITKPMNSYFFFVARNEIEGYSRWCIRCYENRKKREEDIILLVPNKIRPSS